MPPVLIFMSNAGFLLPPAMFRFDLVAFNSMFCPFCFPRGSSLSVGSMAESHLVLLHKTLPVRVCCYQEEISLLHCNLLPMHYFHYSRIH